MPSSRAQPKQTNKHKQQTINGILQECSNQHLKSTHRCLRTQTSHNHEGTAMCIAQYLWNECIRNPFVVEDPLPKTWTPQNPLCGAMSHRVVLKTPTHKEAYIQTITWNGNSLISTSLLKSVVWVEEAFTVCLLHLFTQVTLISDQVISTPSSF